MSLQGRGLLGRIRSRLLVTLAAAAVLPVSVVGGYAIHSAVAAMRGAAMSSALEKAALQARRVQDLIDGARADALYLAQSSGTRNLLEAGADDFEFWHSKAEQQLLSLLRSRPIFAGGAIQGAEGRALVAAYRANNGDYLPWRDMPEEDIGRPMGMIPGRAHMSIQPSGRLEIQVGAAARGGWVRLLVDRNPLLAEVGPATATVHYFLQGAFHQASPGPAWPGDVARALAGDRPGSAAIGFDQVLAFHPVKVAEDLPTWQLLRVESGQTAFASVRRLRTVLAVVLACGLGGVMLLAAAVSRGLTRPLESLAAAAHRFGEGDLSQRVDIHSGDETEELAGAFNHMAEQLDGAYNTLERRVEERTAELSTALAELREAHQKLRETERLTVMGQMAAAVAHEVNNPMGVISMNAQMAKEAATLPEGVQRRLDIIEMHAERVGRIVGNLLEFARREEHGPPEGLVALRHVLDHAVEDLHGRRVGADIQTVVQPGGDLPAVRGDKDQLIAVFSNVFLNAAQAMEGKGRLWVDVARHDRDVDILVRDEGPGMSAEVAAHAFEPFFTTKSRGEGTGLGLAIVRRLITVQGGSVRIESTPGQGTTLHIRLLAADHPVGRASGRTE